jgi:excisionase family DNA binding protein
MQPFETAARPRRTTRPAVEVEDRLLNVHDAAAILGLKPSTLYQWTYERRIHVVKLFGRALRFRLSVIQKLIQDSERPALRPPSGSDQPSA